MSIWTEPNAGAAFTSQQFTSTHVNKIVDSERSIFLTLAAQRVQAVTDWTQQSAWWLEKAQCWAAVTASGTLTARTDSGLTVPTGSGAMGATTYSLGSYDLPAATSVQVEAYGANVIRSTDWGANWTELFSAASMSSYVGTGFGALWMGGASNVRLVPVARSSDNTVAMLYADGASTFTRVTLPSNDIGSTTSVNLSMATDGAGGAILAGAYDTKIWICSSYGVSTGLWTASTLPASTLNGPSWIDYDSTRSLYVLVRRNWGTGGDTIQFTTSANGSSWQAWKTMPFTYGPTSSGNQVRIRCIDGVWFVTNRERIASAASWQNVLWASYDGGASWCRLGPIGYLSVEGTSTAYDNVLAKATDGRLLLAQTSSYGCCLVRLGPFLTPTLQASA